MSQLTDIVSLEKAAQSAIAEQRYEQARLLYSRALYIANELRRFRLMAVLFDRLGQLFEKQDEIQDATIAYESGLKMLTADSDLNFEPTLSKLRTVNKESGAQPNDLEEMLLQLGAVSKEYGDYRQIPVPHLYSPVISQELEMYTSTKFTLFPCFSVYLPTCLPVSLFPYLPVYLYTKTKPCGFVWVLPSIYSSL